MHTNGTDGERLIVITCLASAAAALAFALWLAAGPTARAAGFAAGYSAGYAACGSPNDCGPGKPAGGR